jgi:hypothetical protein
LLNRIKLTVSKEKAIKEYILNLNLKGFAPPLNAVREIANKLLVRRGGDLVSKL